MLDNNKKLSKNALETFLFERDFCRLQMWRLLPTTDADFYLDSRLEAIDTNLKLEIKLKSS